MPVCPECRTDQARRVQGECPNCNTPVSLYKGRWYRTENGNPAVQILECFERLYSKKLSSQRDKPIRFNFPRKSPQYHRNMVIAEKLLEEADFDIDTTVEALRLLFEDNHFSWKSFSSLLMVRNDWPTAVALARSNIEDKRRRKDSERTFFDRLPELPTRKP